ADGGGRRVHAGEGLSGGGGAGRDRRVRVAEADGIDHQDIAGLGRCAARDTKACRQRIAARGAVDDDAVVTGEAAEEHDARRAAGDVDAERIAALATAVDADDRFAYRRLVRDQEIHLVVRDI